MENLLDLYETHDRKLRNGVLSIHPEKWIKRICAASLVTIELSANEKCGSTIFKIGNAEIKYLRELRSTIFPLQKVREKGYYLADPLLKRAYESHHPSQRDIESAIAEAMVCFDPVSLIEHNTPMGRIDCLTPNELIEIKSQKYWKHGLGQLLAYHMYFKERKPILFLFNHVEDNSSRHSIIDICANYGVEVQFEIITNNSFNVDRLFRWRFKSKPQ